MENLRPYILTTFSFCQGKDHAGLLGSCQMTAWLHTWEANEWRRKASACLQPGANMKSPGSVGVNNSWSCSSRCDASRVQAEATVEEGAWGPLLKCEGVTHQFAGSRVRWRPGHGWFLEVWDKPWSSTLYRSPFWVDLVGFSSWSPCSKGSDQLFQSAGGLATRIYSLTAAKSGVFWCITHGSQTLGVDGTKNKAAWHPLLQSLVVWGQGVPVPIAESCRQPDTMLAQLYAEAWLLGDRVWVLLSSHQSSPHTWCVWGSLAGCLVILKPFCEIKTTTAVKYELPVALELLVEKLKHTIK